MSPHPPLSFPGAKGEGPFLRLLQAPRFDRGGGDSHTGKVRSWPKLAAKPPLVDLPRKGFPSGSAFVGRRRTRLQRPRDSIPYEAPGGPGHRAANSRNTNWTQRLLFNLPPGEWSSKGGRRTGRHCPGREAGNFRSPRQGARLRTVGPFWNCRTLKRHVGMMQPPGAEVKAIAQGRS